MDLIRYMFVGILMNFIGGWVTDFTTAYVCKQQGITLSKTVEIAVIRKEQGEMTYNSIKVVKGNGGYGGPLVITPTEENINLFTLQVAARNPQSLIKS